MIESGSVGDVLRVGRRFGVQFLLSGEPRGDGDRLCSPLAEPSGEHGRIAVRGPDGLGPVAAMASSRPGQSAWSERTKPRSTERRRRVPRMVIQPEAKAVDEGPNLRAHGRAVGRRRRNDNPPGPVRSVRGGAGVAGSAARRCRRPGKRRSASRRRRDRRSGRLRGRVPTGAAGTCPARNRTAGRCGRRQRWIATRSSRRRRRRPGTASGRSADRTLIR